MNRIEYRGYTESEIDSLINSGQAAAMGYGPGREGAYNWIDAFYDAHHKKKDGITYLKPNNDTRKNMIKANTDLYNIRCAADEVRLDYR